LASRAVIRVCGPDAARFVNNLCTNDVYALANRSHGLYTGFLNARGRLIYDAFVFSGPVIENASVFDSSGGFSRSPSQETMSSSNNPMVGLRLTESNL